MRLLAIALLAVIICGCSSSKKPQPRTPEEEAMFGPVSMRVHPIFTQVKSFSGGDKPDGVEALLELIDQFGDPTKSAGTVVFELYRYRPYAPDPRGERVINPWIGSLNTLAEQKARWNRTSRTYTFQLRYPQVQRRLSYVLSATFDTGKTRFFDRIVLEAQPKEPELVEPPTTAPTTAPAVEPISIP